MNSVKLRQGLMFPKTARQTIQQFVTKFLSHVTFKGNCWIYKSNCTNKSGYSYIRCPAIGKMRGVHCISYFLFKGRNPKKLQVCHKCDVPRCIRPSHLFLGTRKQNMEDCVRKGRARGGSSKGESNPQSKLTEKDVVDILQRVKYQTVINIARAFGVTQSLIWQIKRRKSWKHIKSN